MKIPSKSSETVHQKLRHQRDRAASRIESLGEQIKEAREISKRHLEAGRDELHAKKELLIEQLQEKRKFIMLTRRQLIGQLKSLSSKDVIQNQRRRKDIKDDFFFASKPEVFKGVRDTDKVEARESLEATDLTDSRGKVNPVAAQARLAKVRDRVESRKGSIRRITGITDGDREQLEEVILQSEVFLLQYGEACKNFHDGNSFAYGKEGKLVPVLRPDLILSKLKLRPFRFYAAKLLELDQAAYSLSRRGQNRRAKKEYLKGYVVCQVFKVQKAFEDCLADVSLKNGFTKKELVQKARELYKTAKSNQIEGYEAIFNHLMEIVNEIGVLLSENPDKLDRETLCLTFKEYLKSIDFQAVLEEAV